MMLMDIRVRDSVLECSSPLELFERLVARESARGLAHSQSWRGPHGVPFLDACIIHVAAGYSSVF